MYWQNLTIFVLTSAFGWIFWLSNFNFVASAKSQLQSTLNFWCTNLFKNILRSCWLWKGVERNSKQKQNKFRFWKILHGGRGAVIGCWLKGVGWVPLPSLWGKLRSLFQKLHVWPHFASIFPIFGLVVKNLLDFAKGSLTFLIGQSYKWEACTLSTRGAGRMKIAFVWQF